MVSLLAKIFIKDRDNTSAPRVRQAYGVLCGIIGILLNVLLFAGKMFAGMISGSIAITADAFNNLSDAGSSAITLIGFKLANKKPDPDHPFGHGRMEYVSALAVSMIILLMGFELAKSSVEKILKPEAIEFSVISVVILSVSILTKLYMAFYNMRIAKKINSLSMRATAADSISDTAATAAVLISLILAGAFNLQIDGYCGILVALFILYAGFNAARDTINPLLGQPPEPEFVTQIEDTVAKYDQIIGIHDLVVHNYGPGRTMISLHAEVPSNGDIMALHDAIDNIERELSTQMKCQAVIHMDPVETDNIAINRIREMVSEMVKSISDELTIHDFRMVTGPTHTNLIFDVVVPFNFKMTDEEVKRTISEKIHKLDGHSFAVINIDKSFVG